MTARVSPFAAILTDIKWGHSVFALPFALIGMVIGTRGELPSARLFGLIVAAMILARSAAMAFNRLSDHRFDATNPRTEGRALPAGRVSRRGMTVFLIACSAGFMAVAASLSPTCLLLSPAVLVVLFGYSLTKRVTAWAHLCVGFALALSPLGAYLAARGHLGDDLGPLLWIGLAVLTWVAGFDVIYACQDVAHDRGEGLHSLPSRLGVHRALSVARGLHVVMVGALVAACLTGGWGAPSWVATGLVAALLVFEHTLVAGGDLSRVNAAFFTLNGIVSLVFSGLVISDLLAW